MNKLTLSYFNEIFVFDPIIAETYAALFFKLHGSGSDLRFNDGFDGVG